MFYVHEFSLKPHPAYHFTATILNKELNAIDYNSNIGILLSDEDYAKLIAYCVSPRPYYYFTFHTLALLDSDLFKQIVSSIEDRLFYFQGRNYIISMPEVQQDAKIIRSRWNPLESYEEVDPIDFIKRKNSKKQLK